MVKIIYVIYKKYKKTFYSFSSAPTTEIFTVVCTNPYNVYFLMYISLFLLSVWYFKNVWL